MALGLKMAGSFGVPNTARVGRDIGSRMVKHGGIRGPLTHMHLFGGGSMGMNSRPMFGFLAGRNWMKTLTSLVGTSKTGKIRSTLEGRVRQVAHGMWKSGKGTDAAKNWAAAETKVYKQAGIKLGINMPGAGQMDEAVKILGSAGGPPKKYVSPASAIKTQSKNGFAYGKAAKIGGAIIGGYGAYQFATNEGDRGLGKVILGGAIIAVASKGKNVMRRMRIAKGRSLGRAGRKAAAMAKG